MRRSEELSVAIQTHLVEEWRWETRN